MNNPLNFSKEEMKECLKILDKLINTCDEITDIYQQASKKFNQIKTGNSSKIEEKNKT